MRAKKIGQGREKDIFIGLSPIYQLVVNLLHSAHFNSIKRQVV